MMTIHGFPVVAFVTLPGTVDGKARRVVLVKRDGAYGANDLYTPYVTAIHVDGCEEWSHGHYMENDYRRALQDMIDRALSYVNYADENG